MLRGHLGMALNETIQISQPGVYSVIKASESTLQYLSSFSYNWVKTWRTQIAVEFSKLIVPWKTEINIENFFKNECLFSFYTTLKTSNPEEVCSLGFDLRIWNLPFLISAKLISPLPSTPAHGSFTISSLLYTQMQKWSVKSCLSTLNLLRKETL